MLLSYRQIIAAIQSTDSTDQESCSIQILPSCLQPATFTALCHALPLIRESLLAYTLQHPSDLRRLVSQQASNVMSVSRGHASTSKPQVTFLFTSPSFITMRPSDHTIRRLTVCFTTFALFVLGLGLINIPKIPIS